MAQRPRIVAELGRPETPEETAARKSASSAAYRSSQTFRNLIAALIVTVGVVLVIVLMVPRGDPAPREPIDVAAIATDLSVAEDRSIVAPDIGEGWVVNVAEIERVGGLRSWTIVFAEDSEAPGAGTGFVRVAQGFDADAAWPARVLRGAAADGSITVDGIEWARYDIPDPARAGNVSVALSTTAGTDTILLYGVTDDATLEMAAASVSDDIRALREEAGG